MAFLLNLICDYEESFAFYSCCVVLVYFKNGDQGYNLQCTILKYDTMLLQPRPLVTWEDSGSCHSELFCCYELWGGDSVKQIKSACSSPNIKGIVLVNQSGQITDPNFWDEDITIPICIVSKAACEELLSLLEQGTRQLRSRHSRTEVIARVSPINGGGYALFYSLYVGILCTLDIKIIVIIPVCD